MVDLSPTSADRVFLFGSFRLLPAQLLLLEGDKPVRLGSRALAILIALVERAGEIVSKEDLIARVWPKAVIEEANLRVNIAALRRALGDGQLGSRYIVNVPGRGYRFVAPTSVSAGGVFSAPFPGEEHARNLPARLTRMIGRGDIVASLVSQLPHRRFIAIVGPGGVGKTTVALAVADELIASYRDGARFLDLSPISDPQRVPSALASAVGLELRSETPMPRLVTFLRDKHMLIILDSCERVIDVAAMMAVELLGAAPAVNILATSREPLRATGERVYRLSPFEVPASSIGLTAAEALTFPAIQLFVERATACMDTFELGDANAPAVADICRRLDGIPLAIELAAGRVDVFGVRALSALLDSRFQLQRQGQRTALPRHRTLAATLDWSHDFLPEIERVILRRLSVFAAGFTLESGAAVSAGTDIDTAQAMEGVTNLVAKSLISADVSGTAVQYRLLDTTRAYALQKLDESGELEALVRRHAEHHRDLFVRAKPEWRTRPSADMLADYKGKIDDVRSALNWSFSTSGEVSVGVSLTIAAIPLWTHLSLLDECGQWASMALAEMTDIDRGSSAELALQEAIAIAAMYTSGNSGEVEQAIERGLSIAARLGDHQYQLHLLAGLNLFLTRLEKYRSALTAAQRFDAVAKLTGGVRERVASEWMLGASYHLLGQQIPARDHYEQGFGLALSSGTTEAHYFGYDHQVRALIGRARVWFLRGLLKQSGEFARQAVSVATSQSHPVTLCIALLYTTPVVLWLGDLPQAEDLVERLIEEASRHALTPYMAGGLALRGEVMLANGELENSISTLRGALASLDVERQYIVTSAAARALAESLMRTNQPEEASHVVDCLLANATTVDSFMLPELLRTRAEMHLAVAYRDTAAAESGFIRAITSAKEQGSLSWELRAALGLARLRVEQGDLSTALEPLREIRRGFGSEAASGDLRAADELLNTLPF